MSSRTFWAVLIAVAALVQRLAVAEAPTVYIPEVNAPSEGSTLSVPVCLTATPDQRIAGLQFELEFDGNVLMLAPKAAVKAGAESAKAEKQVSYSLISPGKARILVVGFNRNTLASGEIASVEFSLRRDRVKSFEPVRVRNVVLSDLSGVKLPEVSKDGGVRFAIASVNNDPDTHVGFSRNAGILVVCVIIVLGAAVAGFLRLRPKAPLLSPAVGSARNKR